MLGLLVCFLRIHSTPWQPVCHVSTKEYTKNLDYSGQSRCTAITPNNAVCVYVYCMYTHSIYTVWTLYTHTLNMKMSSQCKNHYNYMCTNINIIK